MKKLIKIKAKTKNKENKQVEYIINSKAKFFWQKY